MKKKCLVILAVMLLFCFNVNSQKYITKEGHIEIFSQTPIFTIEGINKKVASILNLETGDIVATTLVRSFKFHEALVEDHFNENYMDSEKFPKASFKGKVINNKEVDIKKNGEYKVTVKGDLTIHGETKPVEVESVIIVKDGNISAKTEFDVSLAAYKIKVEERYKDAIKDDIKLSVNFNYSPAVN
jgi:hypothetical protein